VNEAGHALEGRVPLAVAGAEDGEAQVLEERRIAVFRQPFHEFSRIV